MTPAMLSLLVLQSPKNDPSPGTLWPSRTSRGPKTFLRFSRRLQKCKGTWQAMRKDISSGPTKLGLHLNLVCQKQKIEVSLRKNEGFKPMELHLELPWKAKPHSWLLQLSFWLVLWFRFASHDGISVFQSSNSR